MTDAEVLHRALNGEYVGGVARLAPVLVAEIERLRAETENRRDEADRERLQRRDAERWLTQIKETLRPRWEADAGQWDGSLCGLPTQVEGVARYIKELEDDRRSVPCERCDGEGWQWAYEVGNPSGQVFDDTRYSCPDCGGTGRMRRELNCPVCEAIFRDEDGTERASQQEED